MKRLLFINCCLRGEQSRTLRLCKRLIERYRRIHPETAITEVDLDTAALSPTDSRMLAMRDSLLGNWQDPFFAPARQFLEADVLVLGAPFWNGTFPALLHTYLEHICVPGLTFDCVEDQYTGHARASVCVLVTTRGGKYENGSMLGAENATPVIKSIMKMLGVNRVETLAAEGVDLSCENADALMDAAMEKAVQLAETLP